MMLGILPLLAVALASNESTARDYVVDASPRAAQVRLAEALADADSVDAVAIRAPRLVAFRIVRAGEAYEILARTSKKGEVVSVTTRDLGDGGYEIGALSWLCDAMQNTAAVARLVVDEDGAVTLVGSDGQRYMAIPGRGSGGNDVVEARWAAAWNRG